MASFTLTARTTWRCSSKLCSIFTKDWKDDAESHQNPRPVKTPLNITLPEVAKLLSKAIITGASGSDNIPNQLLEELSTEKNPPLTHLFNQTLSQFLKTDAYSSPIYIPDMSMFQIVGTHCGQSLAGQITQTSTCVTLLLSTTTDLAGIYNNNI